MADDGNGDHAVGYRKPPRHTRFQKGKSGNPKGRPKGTLNVATALTRALLETVSVRERGKTRRMTKWELALRQQIKKAAEGDTRSFKMIMELAKECNVAQFHVPLGSYLNEADCSLVDMAEDVVRDHMEIADLGAAKFVLQNHPEAKERGWDARTELTGTDGGPVRADVQAKMVAIISAGGPVGV